MHFRYIAAMMLVMIKRERMIVKVHIKNEGRTWNMLVLSVRPTGVGIGSEHAFH